MTTMTSNLPTYRCNKVVLPIGVAGTYQDMVQELRRAAWRRFAEDQSTRMGDWLRNATNNGN